MRELEDSEAKKTLRGGDDHYLAYVGPPSQYDFMGATQFRLLCALGLRAEHTLLDFGCGSLRAGRLFIPYLDAGRYYGLEPNGWLVDEGLRHHVGAELAQARRPTFLHHDTFAVDPFAVTFDFILAQSIFSHCAPGLLQTCLEQFTANLKSDGLAVATFVEAAGLSEGEATGWVYPGCVTYRPDRVRRMASAAGLETARLPWYHPRQRWYVFAKSCDRLPSRASRMLLTGATLGCPELRASYHVPTRVREGLLRQVRPLVASARRRVGDRLSR